MQAAALNVDEGLPYDKPGQDKSRTATVALRRLQSMALERTAGFTRKLVALALIAVAGSGEERKGQWSMTGSCIMCL
jgi:hypothetical protein